MCDLKVSKGVFQRINSNGEKTEREVVNMKPTRHIVKPNIGLWKPKHSVWFKKNDDDKQSCEHDKGTYISDQIYPTIKRKFRCNTCDKEIEDNAST